MPISASDGLARYPEPPRRRSRRGPACPRSRTASRRRRGRTPTRTRPAESISATASCDSSRRRRASPHSRYSGSDSTSSAMNMVSRSSAAGNSSMPPTANIVSGNTSVCMTPALVASCSATLPAIADACGVNASRPRAPLSLLGCAARSRRSAISRMPSTPTSRMVPCRNSAGVSTATAPITAVWPTAAVQVAGEHDDRDECGDQAAEAERRVGRRSAAGAAGTPRRARRRRPPRSTISIGESRPYSTAVWARFIAPALPPSWGAGSG